MTLAPTSSCHTPFCSLSVHSKSTRQAGGKRKNKAVIKKRDTGSDAFVVPASWHSGHKFKVSFSLKKSR